MGDGITMNSDASSVAPTSTSTPTSTLRTPDDIAFELTTYRDGIRSNLQLHAAKRADAKAHQRQSGAINPALLRILDSAQQYLQHFLRTSITPAALIQFGMRRPMAIGVMAGAAVGAAMLIGPSRLIGWGAKAAAVWRIATAIRHK
jgi:hypothetical protein